MNKLVQQKRKYPCSTLSRISNGLLQPFKVTGILHFATVLLCLTSAKAAVTTDPAASFARIYDFRGFDGAAPYTGLIASGNTLYGTTLTGSTNGSVTPGGDGNGTIFKINTDGTGFVNLYSFSGGSFINSDGALPQGSLVLSGSKLYGSATEGGANGRGTIFSINTDGTGFANLHNFNLTDGNFPYGDLVLSGSVLYGMANGGGAYSNGDIFKVNTDGTGFSVLHNFAAFVDDSNTNSDGAGPFAGLFLSGNVLYGTARWGGQGGGAAMGPGTIFKINTDGSGFSVLHHFSEPAGDGVNPQGTLVISGGTLYGTTLGGGLYGAGTVFKINTDGSGYSIIHNFASTNGVGPLGRLVIAGNTLYGVTGGNNDFGGSVFKINTDGTGFVDLLELPLSGGSATSDGAWPRAGLALVGNKLYGTTSTGGTNDGNPGEVFTLVPDIYTLDAAPIIYYSTPAHDTIQIYEDSSQWPTEPRDVSNKPSSARWEVNMVYGGLSAFITVSDGALCGEDTDQYSTLYDPVGFWDDQGAVIRIRYTDGGLSSPWSNTLDHSFH
jgi:uncharacterized repeat protein (TIGR03803 family)